MLRSMGPQSWTRTAIPFLKCTWRAPRSPPGFGLPLCVAYLNCQLGVLITHSNHNGPLGLEPFLRIPLCLTGVQLLFQVLARLLLSSLCALLSFSLGTRVPPAPWGWVLDRCMNPWSWILPALRKPASPPSLDVCPWCTSGSFLKHLNLVGKTRQRRTHFFPGSRKKAAIWEAH